MAGASLVVSSHGESGLAILRQAILAAARPAAELTQRFARDAAAINEGMAQSGRRADALRYLPIQGRKGVVWTVLLDARTAQPVGFVPLDSF